MLYIPNVGDYLKILTDEEVKYFEDINFSEYFKSTRKKLYSKLNEEQNLRKVAESLQIFPTKPDEVEKFVEMMQSNSSYNCQHHYNVEILNLLDPKLQLINPTPLTLHKFF